MAITRSDIATSLEYGVKAGFLEGQQLYQPLSAPFVRTVDSNGKFERYAGLGAHPMPRQFTDQIVVKGLHENTLTINNLDWEVSVSVDDDAINDDRVGWVLDWAKEAGQSFVRHMDKLAFQALNGGDTTTYGLCYDGKDFYSATHADVGAEYSTAQSNINTLSLSWVNFNTARVNAFGFLDNRGEPVDLVPDLLVVHPSNEAMAFQITQNREKENTANRDANPYAGKVQYVVSPYLDSTAWVLVASGYVGKPIIFQMRQQPALEVIRVGEERKSIYSFVARYNVGYGDWRLAYQGNT